MRLILLTRHHYLHQSHFRLRSHRGGWEEEVGAKVGEAEQAPKNRARLPGH